MQTRFWEKHKSSERVRSLIKDGLINHLDIEFVIVSHKRPENVEHMTELFPFAIWCISESDSKKYNLPEERKIVHPDSVLGLGRKRQWILDNVDSEIVFQIDDDIKKVVCVVGNHFRKIEDPARIFEVLYFNNHSAKEIGASACSFTQSNNDTRKFIASKPFTLNTWCEGSAIGIIGRHNYFDKDMLTKVDIDFSLRELLNNRYVYVDKRFSLVNDRFNNRGGSSDLRTKEKDEAQIKKLVKKWFPYLSCKKAKTTYRMSLNVKRTQ